MTLLRIRNRLAGQSRLNWSADVAMHEREGVTLNRTHGRVVESVLSPGYIPDSAEKLSGFIPPQSGQLDALRVLRLSSNRLQGEIPAEIGGLKALESLVVRSNRLTGGIPIEIGNLQDLRTLDLSSHRLEGPIPVELGDLDKLKYLHLHPGAPVAGAAQSKLTGCIPKSLSDVELRVGDLRIYD